MQPFNEGEFMPEISGDEIRNARTALNLTITDFAWIIGAEAEAVEAWEAGTIPIPLGGAIKLALDCLRMREYLLTDPVFSTLDTRIEEAEQMLADSRRRRAEFRARYPHLSGQE